MRSPDERSDIRDPGCASIPRIASAFALWASTDKPLTRATGLLYDATDPEMVLRRKDLIEQFNCYVAELPHARLTSP
jgi:hypothetical protein